MNIHFNEVWTGERVARLTKLWASGMSCSQIAAVLGCFQHCSDHGRSAVIGKIHRLKLPHPAIKVMRSGRPTDRSKQPSVPRAKPGTITSQSRPFGETTFRSNRNPSNNIDVKLAIAAAEPGLPERLKGERPDGTGIKFADLSPTNCHWPRGEPSQPDFEFCGGPALAGQPYCARHCRLAHTPQGAQPQHRADGA